MAQAEAAGPLGSLALSVVRPHSSALALRAVRWHGDLGRLGVVVPFNVSHDIGLLLASPNEHLTIAPRTDANVLLPSTEHRRAFAAYHGIVEEIAQSQVAQRSREIGVSDDLVVVLLARILAPVAEQISERPEYSTDIPIHGSIFDRLDDSLPDLFAGETRSFDMTHLEKMSESRLFLLTLVDALDVDTLSLFGMLGGDAMQGALAQVDLIEVLGSPEANDVVNFSLEIIPSVLETKAHRGLGTIASHGYAGLARKGSIDNLVLTELAWDEAELARRLLDREVLYYGREHTHEEAGRVHHLVLDASASMRGERSTFARGMALALAKKLLLSGEDVTIRFFDSRLYEAHSADRGKLPIGRLLSFRGERGRNPNRVFHELITLLDLERRRELREPVVHVFTHAGLYIPRHTVEELTARAKTTAVFMLPSDGKLDLDYTDLLASHWVVDHETLGSRKDRQASALGILDDVEREVMEASASDAASATERAAG